MPDIKDWLCAAAKSMTGATTLLTNVALGQGQVVKPASLGYLEAMNALEMMDPAVDWGVKFNPQGRFDPSAALTPAELCWIMDEMTVRELAWLQGGSMPQTLHTSLHYHNAPALVPKVPKTDPTYPAAYASCAVLQLFVRLFAKSIEGAHTTLSRASGIVRDGEDVWLDTYGVPLETSEDVSRLEWDMEKMARWLEELGPSWDPVKERIVYRSKWMTMVCEQGSLTHHLGTTEKTPVEWAFDDVAPLLRQSMPLPKLQLPSHDETWKQVGEALYQMVEAPREDTPIEELEERMWKLPDMLPVVRALWASEVIHRRHCSPIEEWLASVLGEPLGVLRRLSEQFTESRDRYSFALFCDIIAGTMERTLCAPLNNRPRQRRALMQLSHSWNDQAREAERFAEKGYLGLEPIAAALKARAIDCDLRAALLAFRLHLLAPQEMRAHWWWILRLATARLALPLHDRGVERARALAHIASGMLICYTIVPTGDITRTQFAIRHKVALSNTDHPAQPVFSVWEAARDALDDAYLVPPFDPSPYKPHPRDDPRSVDNYKLERELLWEETKHRHQLSVGQAAAKAWLDKALDLLSGLRYSKGNEEDSLPIDIYRTSIALGEALQKSGRLVWEKDTDKRLPHDSRDRSYPRLIRVDGRDQRR